MYGEIVIDLFSSLDLLHFTNILHMLLSSSCNIYKRKIQLSMAFWDSPRSHKVALAIFFCASKILMTALITPHASNMDLSMLSSLVNVSYKLVSFLRRVTKLNLSVFPASSIMSGIGQTQSKHLLNEI